MVKKHVAFAPASQKQLGSRLRSPLLRRETVPTQPFSRFFHHTAFAKLGNEKKGTGLFAERVLSQKCQIRRDFSRLSRRVIPSFFAASTASLNSPWVILLPRGEL